MKQKELPLGWVKLCRKMLHWEHFQQPSYLTVFITLLLTANHKSRYWKGVKIEPGETVISLKSICKLTGLSTPTICKVLKGLEKSGEISRKRQRGLSSLTCILNYADYQFINYSQTKKTLHTPLHKQEVYSNYTHYNDNIGAEKILKEMLSGGILVEQFCKNEHISVKQFEQLAHDVINDWKLTKQTHINENDARRHLLSAIRVRKQKLNLVSDNIEQRLQQLVKDCKRLVAQGFPVNKVRDFYAYWTQPTTDGSGRMLFESVRAFDCETKFKAYFKSKKGY